MNFTPEDIDILFASTEDCTPLWEAKWEYNRHASTASDLELVQLAQIALRNLLTEGLVSLSRCSSWTGGTYTDVGLIEAQQIVHDANSWQSPTQEQSSWFCFYATDEGIRVLREDEQVKAYYQSDDFLSRYPDPEWHPMKRSQCI